MKMSAVAALALIGICACGTYSPRPSSVDSTSPATCASGLGGLLTASQIGSDFMQVGEGTSPVLGLWNNGDAAYPDFKSMSDRRFIWNGLTKGTGRTEVVQAWADLHYSGSPPIDFIPHSGRLFASYPSQVFMVAESRADFGATSDAEHWMSFQRQNNQPNSNPNTRNGIETIPAVQQVGDDTFEFQTTSGQSADLYTDVEARVGSIIYAVSLDSGPAYAASGDAASLVTRLCAQVQSTCGAP